MLQRIPTLRNIGKFYDYQWKNVDLPALGKQAVFFGPNGCGKSTFVAVLRSLARNAPGILIGRKTISKQDSPFAVVEWEKKEKSVFQNGVWEKRLPSGVRIEVFDPEYVRDNLFTNTVTPDHRREMCQIVLGEKGKEIKKRLDDAQERVKDATKKKKEWDKEKENKDRSVRPKGTEDYDYLTLKDSIKKAQVEARAKEIADRYAAKQREEEVRKMPLPDRLALQPPLFEKWKEALSECSQTLHESAKRNVEEHLQSHFDDVKVGESFVWQGSRKTSATCPFCGQDLKGASDLMNAYRDYFDESYAAAKRRLEALKREIDGWHPDAALADLHRAENVTLERAKSWHQHIASLEPPRPLTDNWDSLSAEVSRDIERLKHEVETKWQSPDKVADLSPLEDIADRFENLSKAVGSYNELVDRACLQISAFLDSLKGETLEQVRARMEMARHFVERYTPEAEEWCEQYRSVVAEADRAEALEKQVKRELKKHSDEVFRVHEKRMNEILKELGADFQLPKWGATIGGNVKSAAAEFQIGIQGIEVSPFGHKEDSPNFGNTLSEGDRNTMAFAFFLSTLERRADLASTVVVFDDPVSSLDLDRRRGVIRALKDLSDKVKQLLILTHNMDFLRPLPAPQFFPEASYIKVISDESAGSRFVPLDPKECVRSEHKKQVERLQRYLVSQAGEETEDMRELVRKVLETALDFKYFDVLEGAQELSGMISVLARKQMIESSLLASMTRLNEDSRTSHHGGTDYKVLRDSSRGEILPLIRETLEVLKKI